ncbi:pleckstrin homology domain-containing family M member 1 [Discoglossus pictus]
MIPDNNAISWLHQMAVDNGPEVERRGRERDRRKETAREKVRGRETAQEPQRITKKLSSSLRALQIRYVTTDDVVTSDDDDANALCVALEAVFVHGLKAKFIKTQPERRNGRNKGRHVALPQPAYWNLLKAITHRNVITELERVGYLTTDVGRCRSWLRLALNDSLMECYFISLRREKTRLMEYYQPFALLLDTEDCDVVLTYLQGLSSLTFSLSYKSSILNEWTATPLLLSGLWSEDSERCEHRRRKSLDSVSQSSSSDDTNSSMISESKCNLQTSSPSTDTNSSSSQLSSSLGSDGHPQTSVTTDPVQIERSKLFSSEEVNSNESSRSSTEDADFDLLSDPVSLHTSILPDTKSETHEVILRDSNGQNQLDTTNTSTQRVNITEVRDQNLNVGEIAHTWDPPSKYTEGDTTSRHQTTPRYDGGSSVHKDSSSQKETDSSPCPELPDSSPRSELQVIPRSTKSASGLSLNTELDVCPSDPPKTLEEECPVSPKRSQKGQKLTSQFSQELTKSRSWISEEDLHRTDAITPVEQSEDGHLSNSPTHPTVNQAFHVVHRRQIGLTNPFRGLLMLGYLERRTTLGLYKSFYCELSPYELRLFLNEEERICLENWSLLRCESVGGAFSDGRFELQFSGKKFLLLRAPSKDEAQDWVDRLQEALQKCRPQQEEPWEVVEYTDPSTLDKKLCSPSKGSDSSLGTEGVSEGFDWACPLAMESDALKESVLYMKIHRKWTRFVFSLSERSLKCFQPKNSEKLLYSKYSMDMVKDIVPDTSLGSCSCFRLVTTKGSLQLQAENPQEAKTWREMVRASYLESTDESPFVPEVVTFHIKSHIHQHSLFQYLLHIPMEEGLDSQSFKCAGCCKQIGFQFGKAKLCAYSGLYYCELCHQDETSVIPSRMVHNWDITERAISRPALNFLTMVRNEPLINVQSLNERLYEHAHSMYEISRSRERLRLLAEYLVTCRSGAWQELSKSLDGRNYLLECADTYSVCDLKQIADGGFKSFLDTLLQFATRHVYNCDLCSQRGFICQICDGNEIIYPFEFETTTRCGDCKAVFHRPCATPGIKCPRCLRRKKYQNQRVKM